jgi:hypothetical protein
MNESLDDSLTVEPFGFFTLEALRAGWYLIWRQLVRVVPVAAGAVVAAALLGSVGLGIVGIVVATLGIVAASIWGMMLVPQLASQWARVRYGYPLSGAGRVWWGITWRVSVASLVAGVILTPPNFVALSLTSSFPASALGQLGTLLTGVIGLVNAVVSVLATGWAMSRVTAAQLAGLPITRAPLAPAPVAAASPVTVAAPTPRPVPHAGAAEGKRQCPKCGLYETERGTVIGWYCTICGWREARG